MNHKKKDIIYDEAMIKLNHGMEFGMTYEQRDDILEALERAKNVEEELEYTKKQLDNYWKEVCILKQRLEKVEELLGLKNELISFYQELVFSKGNTRTLYKHINTLKELIKQLEEEMK